MALNNVACGADVHVDDDEALLWAMRVASKRGHLAVVDRLLAAGANVHARNDKALEAASENGHVTVVERLLAAGADVHAGDDSALRSASDGGHLAVMERLLAAEANVHADNDEALRWASQLGHLDVVGLLLRHGGYVECVDWTRIPRPEWPRFVQAIPRAQFLRLPQDVQSIWLRSNLRLHSRLQHSIQRARDRLDRPPTAQLGKALPTRDELIAHLRTAGRRFAREYWTDGIPLFFREHQAGLGPLPDEFVYISDRAL